MKKILASFCICYFLYLLPAIFWGDFNTGAVCLPEKLQKASHTDLLWPLSFLPRAANVACGIDPPQKLAGGEDHREWENRAKPVPLPGGWHLTATRLPTKHLWDIWLLETALTTKSRWHFRVGFFRWDDVDNYLTFPTIAIKKISPDWERLLWQSIQG